MSTKNLPKRVKEALNKLPDFSELLKYYDFGNCIEFVVNRYGDINTYRVYSNGEVTER